MLKKILIATMKRKQYGVLFTENKNIFCEKYSSNLTKPNTFLHDNVGYTYLKKTNTELSLGQTLCYNIFSIY